MKCLNILSQVDTCFLYIQTDCRADKESYILVSIIRQPSGSNNTSFSDPYIFLSAQFERSHQNGKEDQYLFHNYGLIKMFIVIIVIK